MLNGTTIREQRSLRRLGQVWRCTIQVGWLSVEGGLEASGITQALARSGEASWALTLVAQDSGASRDPCKSMAASAIRSTFCDPERSPCAGLTCILEVESRSFREKALFS